MSRRTSFATFLFGILYLIGILLSSVRASSPPNERPYGGLYDPWFNDDLPPSQNCFNETLLGEYNDRFGDSISQSLSIYHKNHFKYLELITNVDYYTFRLQSAYGGENSLAKYLNRFHCSYTRSSFMKEPEWYEGYDGDVLVSLLPNSRFTFFPSNLSVLRFQDNSFLDEAALSGFESLVHSLHYPQIDHRTLTALFLNEAHRHLIHISSIYGQPAYRYGEHEDFFPRIPNSTLVFVDKFCDCFTELTHSGLRWWNLSNWISSERLAARKAIRTAFFVVDFVRQYIRVNPHPTRSVDVASMLLDAVFEGVGLPSLNMDLGGEELAWYTLKAVDGDLEPLLGKVLERLVLTLRRNPPVSWT